MQTPLSRVLLVVASLFVFSASDCDGPTSVLSPEPAIDLLVNPRGPLDLMVGESIRIVATLTNAPAGTQVVFTSSDAGVASVDTAGLVRCAAPGIVTVTASASLSNGLSRSSAVLVRCTAPPAPPAEPLTVSPLVVAFEHVVGTTACPQAVGPLTIGNASSAPFLVAFSPTFHAIRISPDRVNVGPGGSVTAGLSFDCSTTSSFTADVRVEAQRDGAVIASRSVTITGTIRR